MPDGRIKRCQFEQLSPANLVNEAGWQIICSIQSSFTQSAVEGEQ